MIVIRRWELRLVDSETRESTVHRRFFNPYSAQAHRRRLNARMERQTADREALADLHPAMLDKMIPEYVEHLYFMVVDRKLVKANLECSERVARIAAEARVG